AVVEAVPPRNQIYQRRKATSCATTKSGIAGARQPAADLPVRTHRPHLVRRLGVGAAVAPARWLAQAAAAGVGEGAAPDGLWRGGARASEGGAPAERRTPGAPRAR